MKRSSLFFVLVFSSFLCGATHAQEAFINIDTALKSAQAKQLPVFIDFSAVWCHSCHAMDAKVLNGAEWISANRRFVLVRSDADSANGASWMKKLGIPALPTYIVLNPDGSERGRLTGEFPREQFYKSLDRVLSGQEALGKLKQQATNGSVRAAAKALDAYAARGQQTEGVRWFASLPAAVRKAVQNDPDAQTRLAVVQADAEKHQLYYVAKPTLSAAERKSLGESCRTHAQQALRGKLALNEHFAVAGTLLECSQDLPASQRKDLITAQVPALKALYEEKLPSADSDALRTATYVLAGYYKALGDSAGEKATFQRGIAISGKSLDDGHGGFDVKRDEAMAEVLGEFLMREGLDGKRTELLKDLVLAYPDNYYYQAEYGKDLLKHGKAAEALPYLERAAATASDQDKLGIAWERAKALIALNRRPEAEKLFNEAKRQAEAEFPEITKLRLQYMKL